MEYIYEYLIFFAKLMTFVICLMIPIFVIILSRKSESDNCENHLRVRKINDRFEKLGLVIQKESLDQRAYKKKIKALNSKKNRTSDNLKNKTFLLYFNGDLKASNVENLKDEITAILCVAEKHDRVILGLESPGGTLHGYGLAASQLGRIKNKGIHLTVAVDKVAASGGYLMACVADQIVAAPFAIIGSIGVVAQIPNFNQLLKKNNVQLELLTAGKHKRTLTMFGENTKEGREKLQEELDIAHQIFKEFVTTHRPKTDIEKVATGEYWQAKNAVELGLVDRLATSDEIIIESTQNSEVFEITTKNRKIFQVSIMQG